MENLVWILYVGILAIFLLGIAIYVGINEIRLNKEIEKIDEELYRFLYNFKEITSEDFLYLRKGYSGNNYLSNEYNVPGIYILNNNTENICYVGQGKKVFTRVNAHFTGNGNGDVYADYKYGSAFTVRIVTLESTNYTSLNELEREYIRLFDSYENGYNRTRGNN